jgi:hypothetical protein
MGMAKAEPVLCSNENNASSNNVFGKRAPQASERRTPPTLRTSSILTYNGSTQRYSNSFK